MRSKFERGHGLGERGGGSLGEAPYLDASPLSNFDDAVPVVTARVAESRERSN